MDKRIQIIKVPKGAKVKLKGEFNSITLFDYIVDSEKEDLFVLMGDPEAKEPVDSFNLSALFRLVNGE